jgi:hypothetical protein
MICDTRHRQWAWISLDSVQGENKLTIAQLITRLQKLDQNAIVMVYNADNEEPERMNGILSGPWENISRGFGGKLITRPGLAENEVMFI